MTIRWSPPTTPQPDPSLPSRWASVPDAERRPSHPRPLHRPKDDARRPPDPIRGLGRSKAVAQRAAFRPREVPTELSHLEPDTVGEIAGLAESSTYVGKSARIVAS